MNDSVSLQSDLLLAAFAEPEEAESAWARWQVDSNWEQSLAFDAYLLLPRVYHNLGGRGVDDALFKRLKGVVKRSWAANARTREAMGRVAHIFQGNAIDSIVLPPCSLLLQDRSAILEADTAIAFQVTRRDAMLAADLLQAASWRRVGSDVPQWSLPGYIAASTSLCFCDAGGNRLELHWVDMLRERDAGAVRQEQQGQVFGCLDTHASVQYLMSSPDTGSALVRLSRSMVLLGDSPDTAAWNCLLAYLHMSGSSFQNVVTHLSEAGGALPKDDGYRERLTVEPSAIIATDAWESGFGDRLGKRWRRYRALLGRETAFARAVIYLPGFLMGKWRLQHLGELLPRLWRAVRYQWRQRKVGR